MSKGRKRILKALQTILIAGLLTAAIPGGLVFGYFIEEVAAKKQLSMLTNYRPSTPTRLYDRNGKVFAELFLHKQEIIPYRKIPPHVVQAFLAVEDDNFYNHMGIDLLGILRAAIINLRAMSIVQGGSTLTQQLAKQIYLNAEGVRARNFTQKIRETVLAIQMEEELSKEEILEVYFNVIYLGHGCKGLACASRVYFNKNVEDLSLAEGAVLARLPKSPVEYSPFKNPRRAKEQHKVVLGLMADNGFIEREKIDEIHNNFWDEYWGRVIITPPSRNIWAKRLDLAPFFTDYVRRTLESVDEVGVEALYQNGLKVYTTLDLDFQKIAEEESLKMRKVANTVGQRYAQEGKQFGVETALFDVFEQLKLLLPLGKIDKRDLNDRSKLRRELETELLDSMELLTGLIPADNASQAVSMFRKDTVQYISNMEVQNAFLNIEPKTGYITAMVGGSEFSPQNQFNRALQARRQPGSAFKIFVYGNALEQRMIGSNTAINDAPIFTITEDGSTWSPGNYNQGFRGLVPAITAMALSLNTCSVQTYFKTGPESIIDFASRLMKISDRNRFTPHPSLALGAGEVTPIELATAISIIANEGRDVIPFAIRYVTDQSGNVLYNEEANVRKTLAEKTSNGSIQVIEPGTAYIIRKMMEAVADHGTVSGGLRDPNRGDFHGDMAGKTGTTSSWSDAWVVGFNPEYATVVWFGFDKSSITLGPGQAGGAIASPVMGHFMRRIYEESLNKKPPRFDDKTPAGVVKGACGGWTMGPAIYDQAYKTVPVEQICADGTHRIYDQRDLLMEEFGITAEDLGVENGKVRFKSE